MHFHDTSTADVEVDDRARETKSYTRRSPRRSCPARRRRRPTSDAAGRCCLAAPLALHAAGSGERVERHYRRRSTRRSAGREPKKATFDVDARPSPKTATPMCHLSVFHRNAHHLSPAL